MTYLLTNNRLAGEDDLGYVQLVSGLISAGTQAYLARKEAKRARAEARAAEFRAEAERARTRRVELTTPKPAQAIASPSAAGQAVSGNAAAISPMMQQYMLALARSSASQAGGVPVPRQRLSPAMMAAIGIGGAAVLLMALRR